MYGASFLLIIKHDFGLSIWRDGCLSGALLASAALKAAYGGFEVVKRDWPLADRVLIE
jgi:hypothetical protein